MSVSTVQCAQAQVLIFSPFLPYSTVEKDLLIPTSKRGNKDFLLRFSCKHACYHCTCLNADAVAQEIKYYKYTLRRTGNADYCRNLSCACPLLLTGCGSGKYLNVNPLVFNIGSDRCLALAKIARKKDHEVSSNMTKVQLLLY